MPASNELDSEMVYYFLEQFVFWNQKFEKSRNIEDYDNAQRFIESLQDYFPKSRFLQSLNFNGYANLFDSLCGSRFKNGASFYVT